MLAELPENLLLFESSKMGSSFQLLLRWNNADERMIAGKSWLKRQLKLRQRSAFYPLFLSGTWISAAHEATVPLLCPSPKLSLLGTLETSLFQRRIYPQISPHILYGPKTATLLTRKLGKKRRRSSIAEMLSKLARTLPPPLMSTRWALSTRLIPGIKTLP